MIDQPARFHEEVLRALRGEATAGAPADAAQQAAAPQQQQDLGAMREGLAEVTGAV